MKPFLTIGAIALLGLAACNQATPQASSSKVLGTLELTIGGKSGESKAVLRPLVSTPEADTSITIGAVTNVYGVDANFRYVTAQFSITANQAFNNLTLYAYNKTGNLGGTALKGLTNFTGGAVAGTAQNLLPIHARTNLGAINTAVADFQAFSSADIAPVQAFVPGETVLQYGFVARKDATTRAFANGETGSITVAYKIPIGSQNDDTYKFTATFVVANETVSRVTRDIDETTTQADARATALSATQVALLGTDSDTTSAPGATTVRINSATIGAAVNMYEENFDLLNTGLPANWSLYTGATASALGTVVTAAPAITNWASTTGAFKNFSSNSCGSAGESGCANRALGVRQTGSFGDPGASFVYTLANTTKFGNYTVEFQAQMLSVQTRSTIWTLDYRIGTGLFTTLGTYADPGIFGSTPTTGTLGVNANNQAQAVEFRISALTSSTGTGSRDSFGIDDFKVKATPIIP